MKKTPLTSLYSLVALLAVGSTAVAQTDRAREKDREAEARKACLTKRVERGIEILADLYLDTKDPMAIYNQGRCYEQNNRYEDAITSFDEYLRKATSLTEAEKADVAKHREECRAKLGFDKDKAPPPTAPIAPVADDKPAPTAKTPPVAPPATEQKDLHLSDTPSVAHRQSSGSSGLRTAGLVTGAVGLAAVGTGIYFYTRATSLSDKVSNSDAPSPSDHKEGKTAETMQWVCYGVGAGALATGAILYILGASSTDDTRSTTTSLLPAVGPNLAGLSLQGVF